MSLNVMIMTFSISIIEREDVAVLSRDLAQTCARLHRLTYLSDGHVTIV